MLQETRRLLVPLLLLSVVVLASCAAGPNELVQVPGSSGYLAGFWMGLWHGMISPITFIISLFNGNVHFYEVHNNGGWYNFGFVLGAGILFGYSSRSSK